MFKYERLVKEAPDKVVDGDKINFGTYNTPFKHVNLTDVHQPYGIEMTDLEKDYKCQAWEAFQIGDDRFFVMCVIASMGFSELMIYDKKLDKCYDIRSNETYNNISKRAHNLLNSEWEHITGDGSTYRIINRLETEGTITFSVESPDINFEFTGDFTDREPIVVVLPFHEKRPFYSHKGLAPGKGYVEIEGERIDFTENAFMIVDDHNGYYPHKFWYDWTTAAEYQDGKLVGIQLTTNQALDPLYNNENCLWYDGKMFPLPDIYFYRCRDRSKRWFIKDDHGYVDLVFEPTKRDVGVQMTFERDAAYLDFYAPFGYLSGTVKGPDGISVTFDKIYCMGESKDGQYYLDCCNID